VQGKEDINIQHFGGKTLKKRLPGKPRQSETFMISGFSRNIGENCVLLGCYTASSSNSLPMYWDNLLASSWLLKMTARLSWNGDKESSLDPP
jgi:hypothetical protein